MFFEEKSLIFQEIIDLISGVDIIISAAWGQISACFKNLTPWFCSLENPGYCALGENLFKHIPCERTSQTENDITRISLHNYGLPNLFPR